MTGRILLVLGGLALLGACSDLLTDEDRELRIEATGSVEGSVFVDVDGSGSQGILDLPFAGLGVRLVESGAGGTVSTAVTDTLGVFRMGPVPVGSFRLTVDPATLPDSLLIFGMDTTGFLIHPDSIVQRNFRLSFPTHTLAEARALPPGRRIFTHGIALNPRDPFGDGAVHLQDGSDYLRATRVERANDLVLGDSVRFLGRTATQAGRPVLDDARVFILVSQAALPRAAEVSSDDAASARDGALDAALVQIRNAEVLDTVSVEEGLIVTADDGSGPVEMLLREFLAFDHTVLEPDSALIERASGLLVPVRSLEGETRWRLTPRFPSDLAVTRKESEEDAGPEEDGGRNAQAPSNRPPPPGGRGPGG
jgi:hypothetical protein